MMARPSGTPKATKVKKARVVWQAHLFCDPLVAHRGQCENVASLHVALVFDRTKQTVERSDSLLDGNRVHETASTLVSPKHAF